MNGEASVERDPGVAWFCLRSQPKHEHIAAERLRERVNIEVFVPRIRFRRPTRRGAVWVTEALFPNYLFARFDWHASLRLVRSMPGVSTVLHFGTRWPTLPDEVIDEMRRSFGPDEIRSVPDELSPGDQIRVCGGSFDGFQGLVVRLLPARQRVAVLLDFLGRQTSVELSPETMVKDNENPRSVLG